MAYISGEVMIAAPIEEVFDLVADERNEPKYNRRIVSAQKVSEGPVGKGARFTAQRNGRQGHDDPRNPRVRPPAPAS